MRAGRLWGLAGALVAVSAGCSLFTDLGGVSAGGESDAGSSTTEVDASASTDGGPSSDVATSDADAGDSLPAGVISYDGFETGALCLPWTPYHATVAQVNDAFAGSQACKICLAEDDAAGGIYRDFGPVEPGIYTVNARGRGMGTTTQLRITIDRSLDDGGVDSLYHNGSLDGASWTQVQYGGKTSGTLSVSLWFGQTFKAGDCGLVDEVIVQKAP